jgi:hypothetical protein
MARLTFAASTAEPYTAYRFDTAEGSDTPADMIGAWTSIPVHGATFRTEGDGRLPAFRGPDGVDLLWRKRLGIRGEVIETTPMPPSQSPPAGSGSSGEDPGEEEPGGSDDDPGAVYGGGGAWANPSDTGDGFSGGTASAVHSGTAIDGGAAGATHAGQNYDGGQAAA